MDENRPAAPKKVQFVRAETALKPPHDVGDATPKTTRRTALLDGALFANLEKLQHELPAMTAELSSLKAAVARMRETEAACGAPPADASGYQPIDTTEQARKQLQHRIRRMQMVLQGRRNDFDTYQPNKQQVSHLGQRQAYWSQLNRALKSLDRVPEPAPQEGPATEPDNIARLVQGMAPDGLPPSPALDQLRNALPEPLGRQQAVLNDMHAMKGADPIRRTLLDADHHNALKDLSEVLHSYITDTYKDLPKDHRQRQQLQQTAESIHTDCKNLRDRLCANPDALKAAGLVLVVDEFQRADKTTGKAREPIRPLGGQRLS